MARPQDTPALLQRPLYVFDLPEELLYTLTLKTVDHQPQQQQKAEQPEPVDTTQGDTPAASNSTSCNLCNLTFRTLQEQRNHARSDLHHYNLKQKIRGLKPVSEADFDKLIGDLDESISGSESSDSESGDEVEGSRYSTLTTLLKRQAKLSQQDNMDEASERRRGAGNPPLLWFSSSALPGNTSLGIYRAIFSAAEQDEQAHVVETIRKKQLSPMHSHSNAHRPEPDGASLAKNSPHYFLCMIGGGHFAAMIVSLQPKETKKAGGISERQAVVLAHKTFHRYTTRRKQGGSQSANDAAKGAAHSAGSSLRRHNEAALSSEVRDLLSAWRSMIDSAELCFIRATGSTNRRILFGPYEGQVLRLNDARSRGFPFSTRRATQKELMRAFVELTRIKVSTVDEAAIAEAEAEKERQASRTVTPKLLKSTKPSEEEEGVAAAATLHTQQIQAMVRRAKAPALLAYLKSNSLPADFRFFPPSSQNYHAPTPLHLASSLSSPAMVTMLLTKASADPTIKSDEGKTAFDLAGDRPTRDAFRVARHQLGESTWPWDAGNVPPPLPPAEAEARSRRDKAEKEAEEKKEADRRRAEADRLRREDAERDDARRDRKFAGKGLQLAGGGAGLLPAKMTAQERRDEDARGLTPEMRARLERERRARAAEERIRRMQGGRGV